MTARHPRVEDASANENTREPARRRGGRRPGAGAPKGNLNALKSGSRSKQLRTLIIALMAFPQTRNVLLRLRAKGASTGNNAQQRRLDRLQKAVNEYARLLKLPSRERTIKSIQVKQTRSAIQSSETIKPCERETPS